MPAEYSASDLDADSDVDLRDFARFVSRFGHEYFDYGPHRDDGEADRLASELSGELRAPDYLYHRTHEDLWVIRTFYPELQNVRDFPQYEPRELLVKLIGGVPADGYTFLNEYYLLAEEEVRPWYRKLTFCDTLNIPVLSQRYSALPEVEYAEPNRSYGEGDDVRITSLGGIYWYTFDHGYEDCMSGCICHQIWVVTVDEDGDVRLNYYINTCEP